MSAGSAAATADTEPVANRCPETSRSPRRGPQSPVHSSPVSGTKNRRGGYRLRVASLPSRLPGPAARPLSLSAPRPSLPASRPPPDLSARVQLSRPRPSPRAGNFLRAVPGPRHREGPETHRLERRSASALAAYRHFRASPAAEVPAAGDDGRRRAGAAGTGTTLPRRPAASHRAPRGAAQVGAGSAGQACGFRPGQAQVCRGWVAASRAGLGAGPDAGVWAGLDPGIFCRRHQAAAQSLRGRPATARTPASEKRGVPVCRLQGPWREPCAA